MRTYKSTKKQQGVTLIVTLIILVAMTTLGLSSIRNTSIQQAIIKNTQFLMSSRNVAKSEINGQLNIINQGGPEDDDQMIMDLKSSLTGAINDAALTTSSTVQPTYGQTLTLTKDNEYGPVPTGGFSFQGETTMNGFTGTITSTADLNGSAANSTQVQGFWYLTPGLQQ
ncbi:MAG: hypothetical protein ACI90U_002152 [Pseudomonadales bacterium]|jgi:hypothetical protein